MEGLEHSEIVPPTAGSSLSVCVVTDPTGDVFFRMPQSASRKPFSGRYLLGDPGGGDADDKPNPAACDACGYKFLCCISQNSNPRKISSSTSATSCSSRLVRVNSEDSQSSS